LIPAAADCRAGFRLPKALRFCVGAFVLVLHPKLGLKRLLTSLLEILVIGIILTRK
jgi:hypothetical protein